MFRSPLAVSGKQRGLVKSGRGLRTCLSSGDRWERGIPKAPGGCFSIRGRLGETRGQAPMICIQQFQLFVLPSNTYCSNSIRLLESSHDIDIHRKNAESSVFVISKSASFNISMMSVSLSFRATRSFFMMSLLVIMVSSSVDLYLFFPGPV